MLGGASLDVTVVKSGCVCVGVCVCVSSGGSVWGLELQMPLGSSYPFPLFLIVWCPRITFRNRSKEDLSIARLARSCYDIKGFMGIHLRY